MVRLSNILSVESRPFHPDTHSLEGEYFIDEAGQRQARLRAGDCSRALSQLAVTRAC